MLKTIEALFVITIVLGSMLVMIQFTQLPSPRISSSIGLVDLAESSLVSIDKNGALTNAVFSSDESEWTNIQQSLGKSLPSNLIYKMTAYRLEINPVTGDLNYIPINTGSNFEGVFPTGSISSSYTVTSPDVTVQQTPKKIGEGTASGPLTLYILNCADSNGWWITGYTGFSLAQDVYNMMSPYFEHTIFVNSTIELERLLNGIKLTADPGERIEDAIVINTFGETVPIPSSYIGNYTAYPFEIGKRVHQYNWTWVSIVGYPFYYASNTVSYSTDSNGWGIFGMKRIGSPGLHAFLQGLDNRPYVYDNTWVTDSIGVVEFIDLIDEAQDYYGVYPGQSQTATRALPLNYMNSFDMILPQDSNGKYYTNIFQPINNWYAGATWQHRDGGAIHGSFMAIGLARTPDIKVALIGLLALYKPSILRSEFSVTETTRVVVLQIGQLGAG